MSKKQVFTIALDDVLVINGVEIQLADGRKRRGSRRQLVINSPDGVRVTRRSRLDKRPPPTDDDASQ